MAEGHGIARVPLQLSRDCIVASIQVDLDEEVAHDAGGGGEGVDRVGEIRERDAQLDGQHRLVDHLPRAGPGDHAA